MITSALQIRGIDRYGSGAFRANRHGRSHKGIDLCIRTGQLDIKGMLINTPVAGRITNIWYPYSQDDSKRPASMDIKVWEAKKAKRYVELTDGYNYRLRFFYTLPLEHIRIGVGIDSNIPLCIAQGLQDVYPGITDHIHFEILTQDGDVINPEDYLRARM